MDETIIVVVTEFHPVFLRLYQVLPSFTWFHIDTIVKQS